MELSFSELGFSELGFPELGFLRHRLSELSFKGLID
jgi:hypothetical protein